MRIMSNYDNRMVGQIEGIEEVIKRLKEHRNVLKSDLESALISPLNYEYRDDECRLIIADLEELKTGKETALQEGWKK